MLVHGNLHGTLVPKEPCVAEDYQGDDSAVPTTKQEHTETATLTFTLFRSNTELL
jgi:hypothetical protein